MKHDRLKNVRKWSFILVLLFSSIQLFAQERTITGTITDAGTGEAMPGVNITVAGTTTGTISDMDGNYSIKVPDAEAELMFSFVSYASQTFTVGDQTAINVSLSADVTELDELIVVGYGTMKKSDVSGSIVSLKSEDISIVKSTNILEAAMGKVPGMDIRVESGRSGDGVTMEIRGKRGLWKKEDEEEVEKNKPLIIVDGVPSEAGLNISSENIESIEILKDASSTAIYGSRGSNGVIIITTKKGSEGKPRFFFNTYYGVSAPISKVPVFDAERFKLAKRDAFRYAQWEQDQTVPWDSIVINENAVYRSPVEQWGAENGVNTDWQELLLKNGSQQEYNFGISGGSEKVRYTTSITYYNQEGVVMNDEFKRYNFHTYIDGDVNKFLTLGASTILTHDERNSPSPDFGAAVDLIPVLPYKDSLGNYIYQPDPANPQRNPLNVADENTDQRKRLSLFVSTFAQVNFTDFLNLRTTFGSELNTEQYGQTDPPKHPDTKPFTNSEVYNQQESQYNWNNVLSFNKTFGIHSINAMVGNEISTFVHEEFRMSNNQQAYARQLYYAMETGNPDFTSIESDYRKNSYSSVFFRTGYTLNDKYTVNVTGRRDGSSQLAEEHKWANFWSAGGVWRISEENFMAAVKGSFLTDLKIRLAYGESGNANIPEYRTLPSLSEIMYYEFGESGSENAAVAYRPSPTLPDATMTWETTGQTNLGIDFGLFKNRLFGNIDVFKSRTVNMLLPDRMPPTTGFDFVHTNAGETRAVGFELFLSSINVSTRDFTWKTTITYSTTRTWIEKLSSGILADDANRWYVGHPANVLELTRYDEATYYIEGMYQIADSTLNEFRGVNPGEIKVMDGNRDGVIDDADRVLYYADPEWLGTLGNTFSYKGIDLTFAIYARMGQMATAGGYGFDPRMYGNRIDIDWWTPNNPTNERPAFNSSETELDFDNNLMFVDCSFMKIQHITLGYTLPKSLIDRVNISKLRIFGTLKNPFLLYSKLVDGLDPEHDGDFEWPLYRVTMIGLNLEF